MPGSARPPARLPRSAPEAHGVSSAAILDFVDAVDATLQHVHGVMVVRHGHVIAEGWWRPYVADEPHALFSLSKSFTSTAVGFAVSEGLLGLDDRVVEMLPDDAPAHVSERLGRLRVRHLLDMSVGHASDGMDVVDMTPGASWAREILALPLVAEPGDRFDYDTSASYLLSAILHRRTGRSLLGYLEPRLLRPLGIDGATWEADPQGISTGGYGLSATTEDVAVFGQLYLQGGVWQGAQLLPTGWTEVATALHIPNGDPGVASDWTQGYGYQFWRSRHGAYRGDGAFGQLCVVMPDRDTVVAVTAGLRDMQLEMNAIWEHLWPALGSAMPLADDPIAHRALRARMGSLALPLPVGNASSPTAARIEGVRFALDPNDLGLTAISWSTPDAAARVTLEINGRAWPILWGHGGWVRGSSPLPKGDLRPLAAAYAWSSDDTWIGRTWYTATPYGHALTATFRDDTVELGIRQNVGFTPPATIRITGHSDL